MKRNVIKYKLTKENEDECDKIYINHDPRVR